MKRQDYYFITEAGQMALLHTHSHFPIIYASLVSYTLTQAAKLKIVLLTTNTSPPDCGIRFTQTSLTLTNILIYVDNFPHLMSAKDDLFSLKSNNRKKHVLCFWQNHLNQSFLIKIFLFKLSF